MRLSSHNFVVFFLQTTQTVGEVLQSRLSFFVLHHPDPDAGVLMQRRCQSVTAHGNWRRFLYGPMNLIITLLWLEQSSCWFSVTLPVLWWTVYSILQVLNHSLSLMVLISTFTGSLLQKTPSSAMSSADWIHCRDVSQFTSDARSIQISSHNIHISS